MRNEQTGVVCEKGQGQRRSTPAPRCGWVVELTTHVLEVLLLLHGEPETRADAYRIWHEMYMLRFAALNLGLCFPSPALRLPPPLPSLPPCCLALKSRAHGGHRSSEKR